MKRILVSIFILAVAASMAVGGTAAFFSDTETSSGNTFTAGGLDLKVDSQSHYNGLVCRDGIWVDPNYVPCNVNQVFNASFEEPVVTDSSKWDIFPPSQTNWQVEWMPTVPATYKGWTRPEHPQLEFHRGIFTPVHEGEQYVELDSDWNGHNGNLNGEPSSVRIYQDINTVPGKTYILSFWFSPRPHIADNKLEVKWGSTVLDVVSASGAGLSHNDWHQYTYTVTASGPVTRLAFADLSQADSLGTFLDDISLVTAKCEPIPPGMGQPCDGTWEETDLEPGIHKFFNFSDIKPGDWGEDTVSVHVYDNDAWGRLVIDNIIDSDGTCVEPETEVEPECGQDGQGELRENMRFWVWLDQGEIPGFQGAGVDSGEGDNIYQPEYEPILIEPGEIDADGEVWEFSPALAAAYQSYCSGQDVSADGHNDYGMCHGLAADGRLVGSCTYYFGIGWELPADTGNEAQTDEFGGDMILEVEQHRNNPNPFQS